MINTFGAERQLKTDKGGSLKKNVSHCLSFLAGAQNLWVLASKTLPASFFFFLFLCHFPDSFNTIIRRALLLAAGPRDTNREKERKTERETERESGDVAAETGADKEGVCVGFCNAAT